MARRVGSSGLPWWRLGVVRGMSLAPPHGGEAVRWGRGSVWMGREGGVGCPVSASAPGRAAVVSMDADRADGRTWARRVEVELLDDQEAERGDRPDLLHTDLLEGDPLQIRVVKQPQPGAQQHRCHIDVQLVGEPSPQDLLDHAGA